MSNETSNVVEKFKFIVSLLPTSTSKEQLELICSKFDSKEEDEKVIVKIIEQAYNVLFDSGTGGSSTGKSLQNLLNDVLDQFDVLIAEHVNDTRDFIEFDDMKKKLRNLFNEIERKNLILQNRVNKLELQMAQLGKSEENLTRINIGNMASQLQNKMVRFMLPDLSKRAARDEHFEYYQNSEKFEELNNFIKTYRSNLTAMDIARSIRSLKRERSKFAHDEITINNENIDTILEKFIHSNDEYLNEQATTVMYFLKLFAKHMHEPLIVNLS